MKYYLYRNQSGYGCDYSIGCGKTLGLLKSKTKEEAIQEVIAMLDDWKDQVIDLDDLHDYICDTGLRHLDQKDQRLDECTILAVAEEIDMFPLLKAKQEEVDKLREELIAKNKLATEKAEYERLKMKFKDK